MYVFIRSCLIALATPKPNVLTELMICRMVELCLVILDFSIIINPFMYDIIIKHAVIMFPQKKDI